MTDIPAITAGDLQPPLKITIGDNRADANFAPVTASQVRVVCEQGGAVVIDDGADTVTASPDGKSLSVVRNWTPGDTNTPGWMWVSVVVTWTDGVPQTFPADGPLRLNILRASGSA